MMFTFDNLTGVNPHYILMMSEEELGAGSMCDPHLAEFSFWFNVPHSKNNRKKEKDTYNFTSIEVCFVNYQH